MNKEINCLEWIRQAKIELEVAVHLEEKFFPKPLEIICFHAQQAAEKSIKAVILYNSSITAVEKTHDLSLLLDRIAQNKINFNPKFYDYADLLFPYSVLTRYPNQLQDSIDEYKTKQAVKYAEEIVRWADPVVVNNQKDSKLA